MRTPTVRNSIHFYFDATVDSARRKQISDQFCMRKETFFIENISGTSVFIVKLGQRIFEPFSEAQILDGNID